MASKKRRKQKTAAHTPKKKRSPSPAASNPSDPQIANMLDQALGYHRQQHLPEAESIYRAILLREPTNADALHLLGLTCAQRELHGEAIELYNQALAHMPHFAGAYNNRGISLNTIGEFSLAIDSFKKSLEISPGDPDTHNNLGNALSKLGKREEAVAHYKKAIQLNPKHTDAYFNLGNTHNKLFNYREAIENYNHALALNPEHINAYNGLALMLRSICDWSDYDKFETEMIKQAQSPTSKLPPFYLLPWSDNPENQLKCASHYTHSIIPSNLPQLNPKPALKDGRIRIGYISSDFRDHVVSHIIAELFELHDRSKFEIFGFALGEKDASPIRKRLQAAFDHFIEVGHLADSQIANLIAEQGIHILVDLTGYSMGARTRILAMRPAPVQVSYLGYIGTMGTDFIDYILTDEISAPSELQPFFTEKLVHLPCYMVNDTQRNVVKETPTRTDVGLPEEGFVFCSFNNSYKITPTIFAIWMRCLHAIPDSVLWLIGDNTRLQENLRQQASAAGIEPARLIFAPRVETGRHLARQRLANLFLDTLPVNAGATASDALWVGLPVLTCLGNSFVARMCGGLVHAAGLPELVVDTLEEYEALAIKLATQPELLRTLRERLNENRDSALLFDSRQFCNNLESVYASMWKNWHGGMSTSDYQDDTFTPSKIKSDKKGTNVGTDKLFEKAVALHQQQHLKQAKKLYNKILSQDNTHAEAFHYMGILHAQQGMQTEAIEFYRKALAITPDASKIHSDLGVALNNLQQQTEALTAFQRAVETDPEDAEAYNNLGGILGYFDRQEEAKHCFFRALEIMPEHDEAHYNLAVVLSDQMKYDEAAEHYSQTLKTNPNHFNALNNLGIIYAIKKQYPEACHCFQQALKIKPDHANTLSQLGMSQRYLCDWSNFEQTKGVLTQWQQSKEGAIPNPFSFLIWSDDPQAQQQCARAYRRSHLKPNIQVINALPSSQDDRIRVAYISADFREHPVAHLTAELYELHDRDKFEITAIAYGSKDTSPMRQRLLKAFDHFYDVDNMDDIEIAELIASKGIHIIVDLLGLTRGNRSGVLARRPAPIQINYLGYVGTMGSDYMDYIIVDEFSVPSDQQPFFDERLVHLPCYMVIDTQREIATEIPTRSACGLPEEGFVFCSFNNTYKITPEIFDIWMRCLNNIPNSVLWLLGDNEWAQENLRNEAKSRGIDPARLVFAARTDSASHLARQRLADLFLDTLPVNAGATASDALWMGLPVLTCAGKSFIARMGGGLVHAAGLPELVTESLEAYESLAIKLAQEPQTLAALRDKLIANRDSAPLFNSREFCLNFEAALTTMWNRWRESLDNNTGTPTNTHVVKSMLKEAIALHRQGDLDAAEQHYRAILDIDPQEADALHLLGAVNAQRGNMDEAVALYHQSIEANPRLFGAYNNLGIALYSTNKHQEAVECFRQAIAIMPNVDAYYNLGNCLYGLQQYEAAVSNYKQALMLDPNHVNAQRNMNASLKQLSR